MWIQSMLGTDLYHVVHWFFVYSILGWAVESIYMSICNKKLTNRGFIFGPICPIYGMGALTVYFILRPLQGNYVLLFICGSILATMLEYITAQIMLSMFGEVWWDYNDKPFNYKGLLCLESSIAWGFYTVFLFMFLQKLVVFIVSSYPYRFGVVIGRCLIAYFLVDFCIHLYKAKVNSYPVKFAEIRESIRAFYRN